MTPLRQRMTEDMQLRGLAPATQQAYLRYVEQLAMFTGKSPDLTTDEDFRQFFLALHKQRSCSRSTATVAIGRLQIPLRSHLPAPLAAPRPVSSASHANLAGHPQRR
jgi:integrase/recombinase XerD